MSDSLVIIPTYNEIENLERVVRAVFSLQHDFDILVVDDNSPDGTAVLAKALMTEFPGRLHLEQRSEKAGLGTAYVHGFQWALSRGYGFIFEMDADFSHNPADLERLYDSCKNQGADVAIGSRYVTGVNVVNWPLSRVLMSYFASRYVELVMRMGIKDATAGFMCYKREVLESIAPENIKFVGYAFQIEMKYRAFVKGFKLVEVPIIFTDRTKGESKMSSAIFKEAVLGVLNLRLQKMTNRL